jgi:hypothetical protein
MINRVSVYTGFVVTEALMWQDSVPLLDATSVLPLLHITVFLVYYQSYSFIDLRCH